MSANTGGPIPVAIIGGGPAGLMAAEVLAYAGIAVQLFDAMPSPGRKFLMAGKGGLNITHTEERDLFLSRYTTRRAELTPIIDAFTPETLRQWMRGLGIDSFVGSSGRVFPSGMKAAPLLRAWLHRLRQTGVRLHMRHRWTGWDENGHLRFLTPAGETGITAAATILALGGGSWARLGSDGAWVPMLAGRGIAIAPLQAANCGFDTGWSAHFRERFAGQPVKSLAARHTDDPVDSPARRGEFMISATGVEGSLIYAFSARLRDEIAAGGSATLNLDLLPDRDESGIAAEIARPRGSRSLASHLQSRLGLKGVKTGLLRELLPGEVFQQPERLAAAIKALPLRLIAPRPLDEAISTAGGVSFAALDPALMLRQLPGVFCAGEMLDWEAPTGGYLLTACLATGRAAGLGALAWLKTQP
mgnify:CR=1 FL=1